MKKTSEMQLNHFARINIIRTGFKGYAHSAFRAFLAHFRSPFPGCPQSMGLIFSMSGGRLRDK